MLRKSEVDANAIKWKQIKKITDILSDIGFDDDLSYKNYSIIFWDSHRSTTIKIIIKSEVKLKLELHIESITTSYSSNTITTIYHYIIGEVIITENNTHITDFINTLKKVFIKELRKLKLEKCTLSTERKLKFSVVKT
jgi:hypothetical protein